MHTRYGRHVQGTGESRLTPIVKGCYKVHMAIRSKGKGKSGGARAITYVRVVNRVVVLLIIYDKSEKENITDAGRDHLIALADSL